MTYLEPRNTAGTARSRTATLLLGALLLAIPALAAVPAAAKDKPQKVQQRQADRGTRAQRSTPPARTSSAPPRQSTTPAAPSTPPPRRSTGPARTSSPPPQATTRVQERRGGESRRSQPHGYREYPNDSTNRDSWRVRTWTGNGDTDRVVSNDRNRQSGHNDRRYDRNHNRRSSSDYYRNHHRSGHYGGYYGGWGGYYGYGNWGYRGYYPWYWPWGPTVYVESDHSANDGWGAIDLDVDPERAEIYIDGQYVGIADEYDGFPTYLWLERGTYDLAVYLDGYETLFRQVSIYPGIVIDVEDHMRSGKSIHPDEYGPTSTVRRDARIERNIEKEDAARTAETRARDEARAREVWTSNAPTSQGTNVGRLYVSVLPPDAAVYLDGHFLGTAGEIGQLSAGLVVEPGDHVLELVRPGYETYREKIAVPPGERTNVEVELDRD